MIATRSRGPTHAGRRAVWAGIATCGLALTVGCQAEHAGMTLPSGKYFHDDVQYFAPGPDFPLANTLAATQRARMRAEGIDPYAVSPGVPESPPGVGTMMRRTPGGATDMDPAQAAPPILQPPPERMEAPGEMVPPPGNF